MTLVELNLKCNPIFELSIVWNKCVSYTFIHIQKPDAYIPTLISDKYFKRYQLRYHILVNMNVIVCFYFW